MNQAYELIRRYRMIEEGEKVIVGVSGGADSVCLLFVLKRYQERTPFELEVVHVEHGIRGKESLEDAAFVEALCCKLGVSFHLVQADVQTEAGKRGMTLEEAGRAVRYEAFEQYRKKAGADKIAVAHNANDQAETVLWNLVRGSGLRGLGGIKPVNGCIVRPLLETGRSEIEEWLDCRHISYRTDRTNLEESYTRNRLRLRVLPYLEQEVNAGAIRHIAGAGMRLQKAEDYLEGLAEQKAEQIGSFTGQEVRLEKEPFLKEEELIQEYLIRYAIQKTGAGLKDVSSIHIRDIRELASGRTGAALDLPGRLRAENTGHFLRISASAQDKAEALQPVTAAVPGETSWGRWRLETALEPYKNQIIPQNKYTKWFDYDTINNTIQMRSRRTGDYLTIDSRGGCKKLKDYFIDVKVPRSERDQIPLLTDGSQVIWCVGYRISEAYKITERTKRILKVQILEVS